MRLGGTFFKSYIQNNFRSLLVSLLAFAFGILAGGIYCIFLPSDALAALQEAIYGMRVLYDADPLRLFAASMFRYFQLWFFLWLCGTGAPGLFFAPFFVGIRGFACGYAVTALILLFGMHGFAAAGVGICLPMLFLLPAMQVLCVLATQHIRISAATQDRLRRRHLFFAYTASYVAVLPVFVLVAFYDGYAAWRLILSLLS